MAFLEHIRELISQVKRLPGNLKTQVKPLIWHRSHVWEYLNGKFGKLLEPE